MDLLVRITCFGVPYQLPKFVSISLGQPVYIFRIRHPIHPMISISTCPRSSVFDLGSQPW